MHPTHLPQVWETHKHFRRTQKQTVSQGNWWEHWGSSLGASNFPGVNWGEVLNCWKTPDPDVHEGVTLHAPTTQSPLQAKYISSWQQHSLIVVRNFGIWKPFQVRQAFPVGLGPGMPTGSWQRAWQFVIHVTTEFLSRGFFLCPCERSGAQTCGSKAHLDTVFQQLLIQYTLAFWWFLVDSWPTWPVSSQQQVIVCVYFLVEPRTQLCHALYTCKQLFVQSPFCFLYHSALKIKPSFCSSLSCLRSNLWISIFPQT